MCDLEANASSPLMFATFLGLNVGLCRDIDLRQGLRLGAGLSQQEPIDGPVSV